MTFKEAENFGAILAEISESSLQGRNFIQSLQDAYESEDYKEYFQLSDEYQRAVVQAWLYPDMDESDVIQENEVSHEEIDQWFDERAVEFEFHPFTLYCSRCSKREAFYIGVTEHRTPFSFCKKCRDDLQRRADCLKSHPERIGA